jgi:hypothetical protein
MAAERLRGRTEILNALVIGSESGSVGKRIPGSWSHDESDKN